MQDQCKKQIGDNLLSINEEEMNKSEEIEKQQQILNDSEKIPEPKKQNDLNPIVNQGQEKQAQNKESSLTKQQIELKKQLQSMQFQPYLIEEAITKTNNLQQAIEFIISKIESNQQEQILGTQANQVKTYFIVRMDLKMGLGKIAAQVGHAALKSFQQMRYSASMNDKDAGLLIQWLQNGKKTKILQAETQNQIRGYLNQASQRLMNTCYIRDAGRTQIAAGSMTVGAIGPARQCDVGFLKKLKEL